MSDSDHYDEDDAKRRFEAALRGAKEASAQPMKDILPTSERKTGREEKRKGAGQMSYLEVDEDVQAVLSLMRKEVAADRLVAVSTAPAQLAPVLWAPLNGQSPLFQ